MTNPENGKKKEKKKRSRSVCIPKTKKNEPEIGLQLDAEGKLSPCRGGMPLQPVEEQMEAFL